VLYFVNIVLSVAWSLIGHKNVLDGLTQTLGYHYQFYFQQQNETAAATVALETTTTGGDVTGMSTTTTSGGEVNATLVTEKQVMEGEEGNTATKPHSSIAGEKKYKIIKKK
jgi:hypothetical protein